MLIDLLKRASSRLFEINFKYPSLNQGGCAIYAHALGVKLREQGFDVKVVSVGSSHYKGRFFNDIQKLREEYSGVLTPEILASNEIECAHMYCQVELFDKTYYIDSKGIQEASDDDMLQYMDWNLSIDGILSLEDCDEVAKCEGWNYRFDRTLIPEIYEYVKDAFNELTSAPEMNQEVLTYSI